MSNSSPSSCPVCGSPRDPHNTGACPHCLMRAAMQPTEGPIDGGGMAVPSLADVAAAFPQLEIIELIGQGGMGCVFKARQPRLNRVVALKLLPASLAQRDPAFAGRFEREGQLLARLHHPNIVAVHDSGTAGEFFFLVMEYVDGVNLRQAMRAQRFTAQQALGIVPHICDALQYAHDEGVLHRDIKPENILLDAKGRVKLADFGIAKLVAEADLASTGSASASADLTHSSAALGTPSYMAPEQRETPQDIDNRADIYSLGVVFYELLTGELPRERFTPPSARSQADPRVDPIVRQALEKDRDRRQRSAGEVRTQVASVTQNEARPQRNTQQPRFITPILLLVLALVVPFLVMSRVGDSNRARAAEHLARIKQQQQHGMALSAQLAEANANAGRAAVRAGNGALADSFREEARREQANFEDRARKTRMEMAIAQAKLADLMNASNPPVNTGWFSWPLVLGSMLPFAAAALILLARSGYARQGLLAGGILLALIAGFLALQSFRHASPLAAVQEGGRAYAPMYATIVHNDTSVCLAHDGVDLHYAVFYAGKFSTTNSGSQNRHGLSWQDDTAIKLASGRTFGLRRDSVNEVFLMINGAEYDLRRGRLFVLHEDGTVLQRGVHPTIEEARSPEKLGKVAREGAAPTALESPTADAASGKPTESWTYMPRHLTGEQLNTWLKSPAASQARWISDISVAAKGGILTVTGPREQVRRAATMLRLGDFPEVKNPLELPLLNMDPAFFTRMVLPELMMKTEFPKPLMTDALLESLSKEGVAASQLGRALSAHVLEYEKATFVNQGVPFESIMKSPGASTYYEATIPCADQPDRPLTFRIERTTQMMGTQSKITALAPWLIEEAKAISPEAK